MKRNALLFFFAILATLPFLSSCKGQHPIGQPVKELGNNLWYIFQDTQNNYWFSSNGNGVYRYDGKTIVNYTTKDGLANDTTRQVQEDASGNIFIATFGGISKFDGTSFSTLQPVASREWTLDRNDLWFSILGKKNEGVLRYDGKTLYNMEFPKHYLHDEIYPRVVNSFFSPYEVYSIYKDRKGAMWFGTSVFGACRFDGKTVKWMYEDDLIYAPNGGTFGIRSIFEDRRGDFWLCNTRNRFVFNFDKTAGSDRLEYVKTDGIKDEALFNGAESIYFSHILEDPEGSIWLTHWTLGAFKYDGSNITRYSVKDGDQEVNLVSMYKDRQGNLWVGTPENGVFKFNGTSFERFKP